MFRIEEYLVKSSLSNSFQSLDWDKLVPTIKGLGLKIEWNTQSGWHIELGNWRIWQVRLGWQSAQLIKGRYCNHKICEGYENGLEEAVNRVLSETKTLPVANT
jgi:hypothetical protein